MLVNTNETAVVLDSEVSRDSSVAVRKLIKQIEQLREINIAHGYIYKPLMRELINRAKLNVTDIFTESRKNPYQHSVLTYGIEALIHRLNGLKTKSPQRKLIQEEMEHIYSAMLKIRSVSTTKLSILLPEICDLIFHFLAKRKEGRAGGIIRDDVMKNVYYAYTQDEIRKNGLYNRFRGKFDLYPLTEPDMATLSNNMLEFNKTLAKTINTYAVEDYKCVVDLFPHLTIFSHKMFGKDFEIKNHIEKFTELRQIKIDDLNLLKLFPCPRKVRSLEIQGNNKMDVVELKESIRLYENIEVFIDDYSACQFLPNPERLKKLKIYNSDVSVDDIFMKKCIRLEELNLYAKGGFDLSVIYDLSKLKKINVIGCSFTPSILEKLSNLETLSLRMDHSPVTHFEPLKKQWLDLLPKLHTLKIILKPNQDLVDILTQSVPCTNVKTLACWAFTPLAMTTSELILERFPNIKLLKFRYHIDNEIIESFKNKGVSIRSMER